MLLEEGGGVTFPSRTIWGSWACTKVWLFAWKATFVPILTMDQLKRKGWVLVGFVVCIKMEMNRAFSHPL